MSAFQSRAATTVEQAAELMTILTIMRPHGSRMEERFIDEFLKPLKPEIDGGGNFWVRVGKDCPVLWSCHIDTVHIAGGIAPVCVGDDHIIKLHPKSRANCLGADDGTGVWLMLNMIRAKKPGVYVFHRGEEKGCIGSSWVAKNEPKKLASIQAAIAFDRRDTGSIITHQFGGRCCSEEFSASLAKAIGLGMKSDNTGTVTDTAQYTKLVGECTNVSVGYSCQHGRSEEQDLPFALSLLERMLDFNAGELVYKRKPGEVEKTSYSGGWARGSNYWTDPKLTYEAGKVWDAKEQGYVWPESSGRVWNAKKKKWVMKDNQQPKSTVRDFMDAEDSKWRVYRLNPDGTEVMETYLALARDFPEQIAKLLEEKKFGMGFLHNHIRKCGGKVGTKFMSIKVAENPHVCPECSRLHVYCHCEPTNSPRVN